MGDRDNNRYLRPAVLIVICLLHGSLIAYLLRAKLTYKSQTATAEAATIFLIFAERRRPPVALQQPVKSPHLLIEPGNLSIPNLAPLDTQMYWAQDNQPGLDAPTIDWIAEAQYSAAEILRREQQNRTPAAPASPVNVAPWDPHAQRLEATGHGLRLRILDPCAAILDLGQTAYGTEERLQLGCTLRKKEPRGDLFEALRKP